MTRERRFGQDTPFCAWIRQREDLNASRHSLTVNDTDLVLHKYKTNVDSVGTRSLQLHMWVEIKTYGGMPSSTQRQTLFDYHQMLCDKRRKLVDSMSPNSRRSVWHFGVYVLSLSGTTPDDSELIRWCCFNKQGALVERVISRDDLVKILRFDVEPSGYKSIGSAMRRHHKNRELIVTERMPLGFDTDVIVRKRS